MKRVVHIIPDLRYGSAERMLFTLLEADRSLRSGFHHHVIAWGDGPHLTMLEQLGVEVTAINGYFHPLDPVGLYRMHQAIKAADPTVIHTHRWSAGVIGRTIGALLGVPVVTTVHEDSFYFGFFRWFLDRMTFFKNSHLAATVPSIQRLLYDRMKLSEDVTIPVIYYGIDIDQILAFAKSKVERGRDEVIGPVRSSDYEAFRIISVGRIEHESGHEILMDAVYLATKRLQINNIPIKPLLYYVGEGDWEIEVEDRHFFFIDNDKGVAIGTHRAVADSVWDLYQFNDCFIQANYCKNVRYSLLEALAFRLPVIATHDPSRGPHDLLEEGEGVTFVKPHDLHDLADAIYKKAERHYFEGPEGRIDKNLALVRKNCARSSMVESYHALYDLCVEK